MTTPRCASGCGAAASHELLRVDGAPFSPPIYACLDAARVHGMGYARRLTAAEFGIKRPSSGSAASPSRPTFPVEAGSVIVPGDGPALVAKRRRLDGPARRKGSRGGGRRAAPAAQA